MLTSACDLSQTIAEFVKSGLRDVHSVRDAVGGLEMLVGVVEFRAVFVGQRGILSIVTLGASLLADSDAIVRVLRMIQSLASVVSAGERAVGVRLKGDGAVQWLRDVNNDSPVEEHVQLASDILHTLGEEVSLKAGTAIVMSYPEYWSKQEGDLAELVVPPESEEYGRIHDLLNGTISQHNSGYGCIPGTTTEGQGYEVVQIKRLQNRPQWHKYFFERKRLASKYKETGGLEQRESSRHMLRHPCRMPLLDPTTNEYHLWHGTSWETTKILTEFGLDPRVSSVSGMFGGGSYFAEDSSKSNQYIPCPKCGKGAIFQGKSVECKCKNDAVFPILLCRVLLGDFHTVMNYDMSVYRGNDPARPVRRPPNKPGSKDAFDSVFGETGANGARATKQNPLKFREYITYDSSQARAQLTP
jgi:hypothetical protein